MKVNMKIIILYTIYSDIPRKLREFSLASSHHVIPLKTINGCEDFHSIVKVAAGDKCSFALTASGKLFSWGSKSLGNAEFV